METEKEGTGKQRDDEHHDDNLVQVAWREPSDLIDAENAVNEIALQEVIARNGDRKNERKERESMGNQQQRHSKHQIDSYYRRRTLPSDQPRGRFECHGLNAGSCGVNLRNGCKGESQGTHYQRRENHD